MINGTVIIGHGPSLKNSGLGEYIDSFHYVMRFPQFGDFQLLKDYGRRTSYYCATNRKGKLLSSFPEFGYYRWSKYNGRTAYKHDNSTDVSKLIHSWQARLPKGAYPFLSHGTAGICIAAAKIKKPITVLGCDALKSGDPDPRRYHNNQRQKKICHSFGCERKLVDEMAKEYAVSIEFK